MSPKNETFKAAFGSTLRTGDMIYRKEAIRAVIDVETYFGISDDQYKKTNDVLNALNQIPAAAAELEE